MFLAAAALAVGCTPFGSGTSHAAGDRASQSVVSRSNPIVSNGRDFTADPAPLVVDNTLYILTGRDTAPSAVNDFLMPEWQMLVTRSEVTQARWTHYPHFVQPQQVFAWTTPGRAYAAQIVRGPDGRFYLYAPVMEASSTNRDRFAIGVAVANSPLGPWRDAHPDGPIVSQSYPVPNTIQNIDPTVFVDDDGRVYLHWGTFGRLKGVELSPGMTTFRGAPNDMTTLTGFFESPWMFKRRGVYYMAYAANNTSTSPLQYELLRPIDPLRATHELPRLRGCEEVRFQVQLGSAADSNSACIGRGIAKPSNSLASWASPTYTDGGKPNSVRSHLCSTKALFTARTLPGMSVTATFVVKTPERVWNLDHRASRHQRIQHALRDVVLLGVETRLVCYHERTEWLLLPSGGVLHAGLVVRRLGLWLQRPPPMRRRTRACCGRASGCRTTGSASRLSSSRSWGRTRW